MMKQVQEMQAKMADMQARLDEMAVTGQAGAGLVKVTLNGKNLMQSIEVEIITGESEPRWVTANISLNKVQGYIPAMKVMNNKEMRAMFVAQALDEADSWKRRYMEYVELSNIFSAIELTKKKVKFPARKKMFAKVH